MAFETVPIYTVSCVCIAASVNAIRLQLEQRPSSHVQRDAIEADFELQNSTTWKDN